MAFNISRLIARWFTNYDDPNSLVSKIRSRRIGPLLRMMEDVFSKKGSVKILDVGGTKSYWNILPPMLLSELNIHITLVNIPGEKIQEEEKHFKWVEGDGCDLREYSDNSFDIVHSNSVIEHVGDWGDMNNFASEIRRLSRRYFVQTPNFWFPIEPHFLAPFFHWLPEPLRVRLIMLVALGHYSRADTVDKAVRSVQSARLLTRPMMRSLFPDSEISMERFFILPKSIVAIRY